MRAPDQTRTALLGALFSAGVVAAMVTTAATHDPAPAPARPSVTQSAGAGALPAREP